MDDLRLLGVACVACAPLKAVIAPILSAVKPFLPPAGRDLSQRDWERVLISQPRMVANTLLDMCGHLTQGPAGQAKLSRAVGLFNDALALYGLNKHKWSNNLRANRCSRANTTLLHFCSSFVHIATPQVCDAQTDACEATKDDDNEDEDDAGGRLATLKEVIEGLQTSLYAHFARPRHFTACSYSIKPLSPYPGRRFQESSSLGVCAALGLYRTERCTDNQYPLQGGGRIGSSDTVNLTYLPPSLSAQDTHLHSEQSPRGKYWWWDASHACDWPLLSCLLPSAARIEDPKDLELLLLDCVRNGAGADVVSDFIR